MNKLLKWIAFLYEGFLAVPLLGGAFIIVSGYTPLLIAGILHAAAVILLLVGKRMAITGNIVGLTGAILGWIPFVGWMLHTTAAAILFIETVYLSLYVTNRTPYRKG